MKANKIPKKKKKNLARLKAKRAVQAKIRAKKKNHKKMRISDLITRQDAKKTKIGSHQAKRSRPNERNQCQ